ncbi:MAG: delta(1)-pyrroline-2-carboxylate reductase family protein [Rubrobacter sp.]|jgi:ornithine cyclodeaminase|nr:delta(1)-pyrroline-2-carboxylate reductase family protein [Rubrobacter sp.]
MKIYTVEETHALLPYRRLAEEIRSVALDGGAGKAYAPERMALPLADGGTLLVMPATDGEIAITKLVSVHPGNGVLGLPTIQGEVVVMEAGTGRRLGVLEGSAVTARRTAALSLLAASELAAHPSGPLLVVGAGTQGRSHLEAFRDGLGISKAFIASRTRGNAEILARHAASLGMEARAVNRPEDAIGEAKLIVTATTSEKPVLPREIGDDVFVAAVGAFRPGMAELAPDLIKNSNVVVDTLEGAKAEAGDLIQAHEAGAFDWKELLELQEFLGSGGRRLPAGRPTIFKSVGNALWDLASARAAFG